MNQKGFTLVEIVIAFGLASALALAIAEIFSQMNQTSLHVTLASTAQLIRQNQIQILSNPTAWQNTMTDPANASFGCIEQLKDCSEAQAPDPARTFAVRDLSNALYYDGNNPRSGFTSGGASCATYPQGSCNLHLQLTWRAVCPSACACVLPDLEVTGVLSYSTSNAQQRSPFNSANYQFALRQSPVLPNVTPSPTAAPSPNPVPVVQMPVSPAVQQQQLQQLCQAIAAAADADGLANAIKTQLSAQGYDALTPYVDNLVATCSKPK